MSIDEYLKRDDRIYRIRQVILCYHVPKESEPYLDIRLTLEDLQRNNAYYYVNALTINKGLRISPQHLARTLVQLVSQEQQQFATSSDQPAGTQGSVQSPSQQKVLSGLYEHPLLLPCPASGRIVSETSEPHSS